MCNKIACVFYVLVALHRSGRCCPRWCYLSGLAVAGFAGGELANEPQDPARAVFCLGFLEKIGKNPF